jgi:peptidoglycan/LPS O-acetylase OafA/YrhL
MRGLRRHGPGRLLAYAAGLLGLGCALVLLPAPWHRFGFFSSYAFMLEGTFLGRCIEFLGGVYLAWRLATRPAGAARWPVCTALGLAWWLACMAAMAMVQAAGSQAPGYHLDSLRLLRIFLNNVGLVPGFCLLLYGLVNEPSALRRLLASRLFGLLGKASYAFYLLHAGLPTELLYSYVSTSRLVQFGLLNLAAVLLYLGFEKPANRWLLNGHSSR